jgi:hypothetical protein
VKSLFSKFHTITRATLSPSSISVPPIKIIGVRSSNGKVYVEVAMSRDFNAKLNDFLRKMGFFAFGRQADGMALLVEYGLFNESLETDEGRDWLAKTGPKYASLRFKTHEYYTQNFSIAKGLRLHLQENKALKQLLREKGLGKYVTEDEWDGWDDRHVDEFYRRYVFAK